jgi:hypothetical protein
MEYFHGLGQNAGERENEIKRLLAFEEWPEDNRFVEEDIEMILSCAHIKCHNPDLMDPDLTFCVPQIPTNGRDSDMDLLSSDDVELSVSTERSWFLWAMWSSMASHCTRKLSIPNDRLNFADALREIISVLLVGLRSLLPSFSVFDWISFTSLGQQID